MATRSPGYNRLGLSIILSSLPLPSQGIFSFFHCTPFLRCPQPKVPPCLARAIARSASDLPSFRISSCCRPVARSASFSLSAFILPPTCCAKRESFSLHTFFFSQKESTERATLPLASISSEGDCAKREPFISAFILPPTCCAKRESFSLHTFFFSQKESTERLREARAPPFRPPSCCQPVARSVGVFLCILSFFLKKKVWEIPTKYGIMERIDEHLFRAAGGTQFF